MYVQRNIEPSSPNHCCRAKAKSITYSECVFVALSILYAVRIRPILIYSLSGSIIVFMLHVINGTIFGRKKIIEHEMRVLMFSTNFI